MPLGDSFLAAPGFVNDFNELYTYYKNTRLLQLAIRDGKLLASFQIGERITDIRVFRWSISSDGSEVRYIDNRGERDIALPAPFDFEWQRATREMVVEGRFPHLNILDTLFVETIGGDLTIKVENNTEVGLGIYREEVMDKTQSLDDAQVEFARLGSLLLLKVLPYREEQWRYLVFNSLTGKVERIDAIGLACIQLPEDHGIIFPGGYYLQNGEYRTFEQSMEGMRFKRSVRSPNGEDVQYVFYHPEQGRNVLLTYNLINRQLQNPLFGHGYARLEDGRMVIFAAEGEEPTRIHPMQVWQTPFCTEEYAARQPARSGFLGRIGNAELGRGVSDLYDLCREIETPAVSIQRYSLLCQNTQRLFDVYHWENDQGNVLFETRPKVACAECNIPVIYGDTPKSDVLENKDMENVAISQEQQNPSIPMPQLEQANQDLVVKSGGQEYAPHVISTPLSFLIKSALNSNIFGEPGWQGTGWRAGRDLKRNDIGGKTGTTNSSKDAWFSGYGPGVVTSVWIGFDDHRRDLGRTSASGAIKDQISGYEGGAKSAQPAWDAYMQVVLNGVPEQPLTPPPGIVTVNIDRSTGQLASGGSSRQEYFIDGTQPTQQAVHEVGTTIIDNGETHELF